MFVLFVQYYVVVLTVKPAAVSQLRVINQTTSSLSVMWNMPEPIRSITQLRSRLNYTSECKGSSSVVSDQLHDL